MHAVTTLALAAARALVAAVLSTAVVAVAPGARAQPEPVEPAVPAACSDGPACFSVGAAAYAKADYAASFASFQRSCDLGYAAGCGAIGEHYELGRGAPIDLARALELYRGAWDGGARNPCAAAARLYRDGKGVAADLGESLRWSQKACDLGSAGECAALGQRHHDGNGVARDLARALVLYGKACDLGSASACNNLALMLNAGEGTAADPVRARALLERACGMKNDIACKNLGAPAAPTAPAAPAPPPAPVDPATACERGDLAVCVDLGYRLETGDGVPKSVAQARKLYDKACTGGNQEGCVLKGMLILDGPRPDVALARTLFDTACQRRLTFGCRNLGFWYLDGRGGAPDAARATELFERACAASDPDAEACEQLCEKAYLDGQFSSDGAPYRAGLVWADRGCSVGSAKSCDQAGVFHLHLSEWAASMDAYAKACALGDGHACSQGAFHLAADGDAPTKDPARAALFDACGRGDKAKCEALRPR
ncbi:MAG: tetratricopeptide repeat protein [Myxococcota bacterium]